MTEIFDKDRMKVRTNVQQLNTIFIMGQELEGKVDDFMETTIDEQELSEALSTKQDTLVSGTNIKTVFGSSILGHGDIPIDNSLSTSSINPVQNKVITTRLNQKADTSSLATVATTGDYDDLVDKPDLSNFVESSDLATVATTGDYDDLTDKPTIPAEPVITGTQPSSGSVGQFWYDSTNADLYICTSDSPLTWTKVISGSGATIVWGNITGTLANQTDLNTALSNKADTSSLAAVATSGDYDDLLNKPTIPAAPVQSNWNESDNTSLAYIQNKPTIPAAQVQANWNESNSASMAYIQNKPSYTTETWTFTLDDDSVITKTVYIVPPSP